MNIEDCEQLGVCAVHVPRGLTAAAWSQGLRQFAARRGGA